MATAAARAPAGGAAPSSAPPDALQADAFRRLFPEQYYAAFVADGLRPDGRPLHRCRPTTVGLGAVASADGSALVKLGSGTTVLAGLRLEVMRPEAGAPDAGSLALSVELLPLAYPDYRRARAPAHRPPPLLPPPLLGRALWVAGAEGLGDEMSDCGRVRGDGRLWNAAPAHRTRGSA